MIRCVNCMKEFDAQYGVCPHCGNIQSRNPQEAYQLCPGTILAGRYVIGKALGVGGFGITYKAWDKKLQAMIAIKEYYPSANGIVNRAPGESQVIIYSGERAAEFQRGKGRFLAEARNMARFNTHPNIVHVYDFFEENATAYIAMEYLDGESYKDFIRRNNGVVSLEIATSVTLSVLDALKEIHRSGIIHRDISPDNVFICKDGIIKLIDFGAARFATGEEEKTLSIILKPGYAPPEQYRSRSRQGPWTDIYAVGAMFYRAVTGKIPDESVNRIVKDVVPAPAQINPEIPEYISNSIMRAMALNYELRFKTVDQFMEALQNKTRVRDVDTELKRRKKFRLALVGSFFILLLTAAGFSMKALIDKRAQATLADAAVVVWYPQWQETGSSWTQEEPEADHGADDFDRMTELFRGYYPNVVIRAEAIPADEYENRLIEALASGRGPVLFESSCLGPAYYEYMASLEETYRLLSQTDELDNYYFLDRYRSYFPEQKQMPMSFSIPVVYANRLIAEDALTVIEDAAQLKQIITSEAGYGVDPDCLEAFGPLEPPITQQYGYRDFVVDLDQELPAGGTVMDTREQRERMLSGKVGYYLSDTSQYQHVQSDMAGVYQVIQLRNIPLQGQFMNLWSVSSGASDTEQRAAMRLLYFLMSKENQQISNLQYDNGLPLHKEVFQEYEEMNTEFAGLNQCIGQLTPGLNIKSERE